MKYVITTLALLLMVSGAMFSQTVSAVQFLDANTAIASGSGGTVVRSNDGGSTWNTLPSGTTNYLFGISFPTSTTGNIVGGNPVNGGQNILRTSNAGNNFSAQ